MIVAVVGVSLNKLNFPEKIIQLSCGMNHCICKTSLKKVYTWGKNENGQLGTGTYYFSKYPELVEYVNKNKLVVNQVGATAYGSVLLDSNSRVWMFGSNGTIKN
eukprot:GHVR01077474.1.p2 GENE.GHVR01077474.1~~GHVR01077474.1.p2  ORF type:complete len:104 (+),score=6.61 GHVR01077474.1:2357-2668(+)